MPVDQSILDRMNSNYAASQPQVASGQQVAPQPQDMSKPTGDFLRALEGPQDRGLMQEAGRQLGGAALGGAQSLGEAGASIGNLVTNPFGLNEKLRQSQEGETSKILNSKIMQRLLPEDIRQKMLGEATTPIKDFEKPDLEKYVPEGADLAFKGGKLATDILTPIGVGKKAQALTKGGKGLSKLATNIAAPAAYEFAAGEFSPFGRAGSAAIAGGVGTLAHAAAKPTMKAISQAGKAGESKFAAAYKELFKDVGDVPVSRLGGTKAADFIDSLASAPKGTGKGVKEVMTEYTTNPTAETAHWAMSELKKVARALEDKALKNAGKGEGTLDAAIQALNPHDKKLYSSTIQFIDKIGKKVESGLVKAGKADGAKAYRDITRGFAEEVAPLRNPAIRAYENATKYTKKAAAKKAVKKLRGDKEFLDKMGKDFPQLQANYLLDLANPFATKTKGAITSAGAGIGGFSLFNKGGH